VHRVQLLWRREPLTPAGRAFLRTVMAATDGDSSAFAEGAL
jgi:LysR family transcriptional regulator, carnitine catabolism transcriptional activator